jgi:hypothetical protein
MPLWVAMLNIHPKPRVIAPGFKIRLKAANAIAPVINAATNARLLLSKPTPRATIGKKRYLEENPKANINPDATPRRTLGGFGSSAVLTTSAIARIPLETIRDSGIRTISK